MALNIPLPDAPDIALGKGFAQGTGLYNMLMQHALQRAQSKRAEEASRRAEDVNQRAAEMQPFNIKHILSQIENANAANARASELQPLQKMLLQAKSQSALSNAAWNNMLMGGGEPQQQNTMQPEQKQDFNTLKSMFTGQGMPSISPQQESTQENIIQPQKQNISNEQILEEGNPRLSAMDKYAGIKGIPQVQTHYDTNGNLITRYPSGKVTMKQIGPSERERNLQKEFDKADAKIVSELQESSLSGQDLNQSYESLNEAFNNPLWKKIHSGIMSKAGEKGRKFQLDAIRNYGTTEQKALLADVESTSNELVSKMAKVFKGPFRIAEQSLIERVKPQAYDTPEAAISKLDTLRKALDKQQYINTRIPDLIRDQGMKANDAFKQAFEEVGGKEFKDMLAEKYKKQTGDESFNLINESKKFNISPDDVEYTAKLKGITPKEVIDRYKEINNAS